MVMFCMNCTVSALCSAGARAMVMLKALYEQKGCYTLHMFAVEKHTFSSGGTRIWRVKNTPHPAASYKLDILYGTTPSIFSSRTARAGPKSNTNTK
jgi:hypothetical protein